LEGNCCGLVKVLSGLVRLDWFEHVIRANQTILGTKPEGRTEIIRHTLTPMEDAENDLREMKVKRWGKRKIIERNGYLL
jgi:hypothetical protein